MDRRRATLSCSISILVRRDMQYINQLRRRIRDLEREAMELSQTLNMLLADVGMLIAENNGLRVLQQHIEEQVWIQDALNLALQEEIRELRVLLAQDAQQPLQQLPEPEPTEAMDPEPEQELIGNTGWGSQPSTSGRVGVDENASPPEAKGA